MAETEYSFGQNRPVRLSKETRRFAYESMHGRYGDDTMRTLYVPLDHISEYEGMSPLCRYDTSIREICRHAPVRICDDEKLAGAATLGYSVFHNVPAVYNGECIFGISHVTLGFDRVLKLGINGIEAELDGYIQKYGLNEFRQSLKNTIASMRIWHKRYVDAATGAVKKNLLRVPFLPPENFSEAVQSLWFTFAFTRLCGTWPGIGRIDVMLGGYLENDLRNGVITINEAREVLAHLFIKGCEWIQSETPRGSGDAQHYQNIILGGTDENENDVTNEVSYLVLDIIEELGISDFPVSIRVNDKTPERFLRRAAEVVRLGGGVIAFYNEKLVIESLLSAGYSMTDARRFANDGCWEVQIPGETQFEYIPFDSLQILLGEVLLSDDAAAGYDSFEELYSAFRGRLEHAVDKIFKQCVNDRVCKSDNGEWMWEERIPSSVCSLFIDGCAKRGKGYYEGGPNYTVCSPHIGGAPDTANSLYAIKKLVFDDKKLSIADLIQDIRENWGNDEVMRSYALNKYSYYGNDNDECDAIMARVLDDFADAVHSYRDKTPIIFVPGVSTFGRQIEWASARPATPFGRKHGDYLAANASPTPGTDAGGATLVIKSYCKADLKKQTTGAALDICLYPKTVEGKNGLDAITGLVSGFCRLGGYFMQLDTVDAETLRKAKQNPAEYKTLSVRVSGWNARFVSLDEKWQQMIIERTERGIQ